MPYVSALVDRVLVVRWRAGAVMPSELDEILTALTEHRRALGKPMAYLIIMGPDADVPSEGVRSNIDLFAFRVRNLVEHTHVVVEATGFLGAAHRSLITANWRRRQETGFAILHRSLDEALRRIATDLGTDYAHLSAEMRTKGMMS